jgi:predicted O-methyltransferase YrrM
MANGFDETWRLASDIDGWLSKGQALALDAGARDLPKDAAIVEIGSHRGRSTVVLARAKPAPARLLAVDPWGDPRWGGGEDALPDFYRNLEAAGVHDQVQVFRGTSEEAAGAWDGDAIGLLWVDGAHDRGSVLIDLDRWEPFVVEGGRVYVHDAFSSPGVTFALLQRHLWSRSFRYVGSVRTLAMLRREELSLPAALWSTFRMIARLAYFLRNVAVKIAMRRDWRLPQRLLGHRGPGFPY